ncbi:MAG: DUF4349 domain-containing protein [Paludibacter sp.]
MKRTMFIVLIALLAISCAKKQKEVTTEMTLMSKMEAPPVLKSAAVSVADVKSIQRDEEVVETTKFAPPSQNNGQIKVSAEVIKKKIIKDGRLGLQVKNLQSAKKGIDSLLKSMDGYYANENLKNDNNQSGYELTIRIPVVNFDKFVNSTEKGNYKVLYKEISARDVTEEFVDLSTRLNSKRNALVRYNEIMRKADKIKDIVEIENAIRTLQEEIESTEGRLRCLNDCVNYSTLNLTISTEKDFSYQPAKRDSFWEKLKESVVEGWFGLVDFVLGLFGMWPYLLLIIPLYIVIRRWIKRRKLRKQQNN